MKVLSASTRGSTLTTFRRYGVRGRLAGDNLLNMSGIENAAKLTPGGGVSEEGSVNQVSFTLPSLPGSVNTIYGPRRTLYSQNGWGLKDEWLIWATKMIPYILLLPRKVAKNSIIRIDRCYYYPWFTKDGNWRRVDTSNMDKLLFDTIAKKIGIDDLFFKLGETDSRDSNKNQVQVMLTEITEIQWRERQ